MTGNVVHIVKAGFKQIQHLRFIDANLHHKSCIATDYHLINLVNYFLMDYMKNLAVVEHCQFQKQANNKKPESSHVFFYPLNK